MKINYVIHTTVVNVEVISNHWYVHFDGSRESIAFSHKSEPAPFTEGDEVKITFEKVKAHETSPNTPTV